MKRISIFILLFLLAACGKDDTPASTDTVPARNIPAGSIENPEWEIDDDYDFSSSMTAVVAVDLTRAYPDITPADWQVDLLDLLGAFVDDECLGVMTPTDSLFFLYIVSPSTSTDDITLRYYSARLHNIFQADTILHFENGARLGSVTNPLTPLFK